MNGLLNGILAALMGALVLTLVVAIRRRDIAAVVNALVSVAGAVLALLLAAGFQLPGQSTGISPGLPLWVTSAGLLHSIGMLGPYESVWWWDHLTHTVSAALVAALLYAGVIVTVETDATLTLSAVTVVYTLGFGIFWEVIELGARTVGERFDIEPVLVHYGWRDTAYDLVFDVVGAVLVVALDLRLFVGFVADFPKITRAVLGWGGGLIIGSVLLVALYLVTRDDHG
ncbi:MAG: hypothetical protein V5A55_08220 [Halovenus sp.]